MPCRRARVALVFCALVSILLGREAPAATKDPGAMEQMATLNKNALAAYKAGRNETARGLLLDAEMLAETNGLLDSDLAARTYLHLGLLHLNGFKEKGKALRYFAQAAQIRPNVTLARALVTPNVRLALREAQRRRQQLLASSAPAPSGAGKNKETAVASAAPSRPAPAETEEKAEVTLDCPVPEEAVPAEEVKVQCRLSPAGRNERAFLFYRPAGSQEYAAIRMSREGAGGYTAAIPSDSVTGRAVEFYVEAEKADGQITATVGEEERPKVVSVRRSATPSSGLALAQVRRDVSRDVRRDESRDESSDTREQSPPSIDERKPAAEELQVAPPLRKQTNGLRRAPGTFFLGVGAGSALGMHRTRPLEHHAGKRVSTGLAFGGMHLLPEIGIQYDERLTLSIQGRHQYIPPSEGPDTAMIGPPPRYAHAVLARVYYEVWEREQLQFLTSATVGGGSGFRLKVPPVPQAGLPSSDTISGGPLVFGPGVTLFINLTESVLLAGDLRLLAGFDKEAAVVEGSFGLQYGF
jgi:hypothetical protein